MKLISRLKQTILNRLFLRPAVLNVALVKAINNPAALTKALSNKDLRATVIDKLGENKTVTQELLQHPNISKQIVRHPIFFETMLRSTVTQPEALFEILSQRGVQSELVAQKGFLRNIANDQELMERAIALVPKNNLPQLAVALFSPYRSIITADESTDADFALTLLAAIDPDNIASGNTLTEMLQAHMQDNLAALLSILALRDPRVISELLENPKLREPLIKALWPDIDTLLSIIRNYAISSKDAPNVASRITLAFDEIMTEKVVTRAFSNDAGLRNAILARLDDMFNSVGESLEDNLPHARARLTSTAPKQKDDSK